ncbi:NAD-dependent epimerase/dehydratase family protein [Mucilaginibacter endophyticus]|uniref:NAD-dependent epimerase/dehydratase family protein n=1 Tax=Mucilaginibacter endophyticus TaxID=2675003 RepID=UPI000E0D3B0F|nr:NAD-dependent epimerase/dehydratase family protein [Mucilaginibacter endophyticus]
MEHDTNQSSPVILVTGARGQIGTELVAALRNVYGRKQVIATDLHDAASISESNRPYHQLNVLDKNELENLVITYGVTQIYHLAATLSAKGEEAPLKAWHLNMQSLLNILEVAKDHKLDKVFWPSSIAVFGPSTARKISPQDALLDPQTVYGISKEAGEQWCAYYREHYGLDVRSIRYPGLISYSAPAGGGTTDYAVAIFHEALQNGSYNCYLNPDTALPMMYMDDAVRATLELMDAPAEVLKERGAYNIGALSFTPAELAIELQKHLPGFTISNDADKRQAIANSWPAGVDDNAATRDWNWTPKYDLAAMTTDMLLHLAPVYKNTNTATVS